MIPIVFTGENRTAAKEAFDKTLKLLAKRGHTITKLDNEDLSSPQAVLGKLSTSMLFGGNTAFALLYPSACSPTCQKSLIKAVKALSKQKTPVVIFEPETGGIFLKEARRALWKIVEYQKGNRSDQQKAILKALAPLKASGQLPDNAAGTFSSLIGEEQHRLTVEAQKIANYPEPLSAELLNDLVPAAKENKVWKLVDLLFAGKSNEARTYARGLLASGEQPPLLMHLLYQQFRKLVLFSALQAEDSTISRSTLISQAGIPPFAYDRFVYASRNYPLKKLKQILATATELEYEMKTGGTTPESALALFLAECS